jgi:hypothetical protein
MFTGAGTFSSESEFKIYRVAPKKLPEADNTRRIFDNLLTSPKKSVRRLSGE